MIHDPQVLDLHKARGSKLIVVKIVARNLPGGHATALESTNLASALEYVQDTVRKMITTDWAADFVEGRDYTIIRDAQQILGFETHFSEILGIASGLKKPARETRGRLFLFESGVKRILDRCSRPGLEAVRLALGKVYPSFRAPDLEPLSQEAPLRSLVQQLDGRRSNELASSGSAVGLRSASAVQIDAPRSVSDSGLSLEDRKFRYDALQTLIRQLETFEAAHLQQLALDAAEVALDRSLPHIRAVLEDPRDRAPGPRSPDDQVVITSPRGGTGTGKPFEEVLPSVGLKLADERSKVIGSSVLEGPRFSGAGFFSLTQIGERAGGYSAKTAGQAADLVAGRRGLSSVSIRTVAHDFNKLVEVPDSTSGKMRPVAHFNASFANQVIDELRGNDQFHPQQVPRVPKFSSGSFPKLTRDVLADEDEPAHFDTSRDPVLEPMGES